MLFMNQEIRSEDIYILPQTDKLNQGLCQRIRTIVNLGQTLRSGDVIAECQSSCNGEMSLGTKSVGSIYVLKGL